MKKVLIYFSGFAIIITVVLALSASYDNTKINSADIQTFLLTSDEIKQVHPYVARIFKKNLYRKSDINNLGLNCPDKNEKASEILQKVESEDIYEIIYIKLRDNPVKIYRTKNPTQLKTEEIKKLFSNCGHKSDNLPLKAGTEYILWGSTECKGSPGGNEKCEYLTKKLINNI
jgi:hypothetical protein